MIKIRDFSRLQQYGIFVLAVFIFFPIKTYVVDAGIPDTSFLQEYHVALPIGKGRANNVFSVAVDSAGIAWAGTSTGLFRFSGNGSNWQAVFFKKINGPVFDLFVSGKGTLYVAAWNGLFKIMKGKLCQLPSIEGPIAAVCVVQGKGLALGPTQAYKLQNGRWQPFRSPFSKAVRQIIFDGKNGFWIATGMGVYHQKPSGVRLIQKETEILSANVGGIAHGPNHSIWMAGLGGVTVYRNGKWVRSFTPKNGLPTAWATCVARSPDGRMWVGTKLGLARFDGKTWSIRNSHRWLLDNIVRDIAFDRAGNAWIATSKGVSVIKRRRMTMQQKAAYFERICLKRHVRPPGLVEKCRLKAPGDTLHWFPRDDDNDGQYTGMYLAMQAFHYAVTKDTAVKARAKQAYDALEFLQTITQTPGFVARTVIPSSWKTMADPNRTWSDQQWAEAEVENPREKRVEHLWRLSADGKWRWKGNTSSDEITGHLFGYLFYYDLVADPREKKRVASHICNIVDYIVDGGFVLRDIDGKATEWGVWSPEKLNHDPDWAAERGVNSLEMLSYLKLAYHVSGNPKYQKIYKNLAFKHNYAENARHAKTYEPSWRTHIDDELLALAFPALLLYEKDPNLKAIYRESLDWWYKGLKADRSPFFDFIYGALSGKNPQPAVSAFALRDASLDLVRWRVDNSRREDLHLVRRPELESLQTDRLVPLSERGVMRWDNNPWNAVQGDGGWTESSGVWWLLPYWMGRYYGFIAE